ncbi:hypothetical protein [Shewanella kaireitica]|uniref:hypothetical protein n=1 Tax=Shewanella kaireitica TaxID=212021 RepID=UPI00200EBF9B|nr:hypothetical protein [Shewanella kaireitica]MCL1095050.1 hypothetical protein [Shewanella kaireitica]
MKKHFVTALAASVISLAASATEVPVKTHKSEHEKVEATEKADIDPSDLTAVNSFTSVSSDDNGKVNAMLGVAGQYSKGNNFLGLIEHGVETRAEGQGQQDSRLRYFQVLETGAQAISQIGFSIDYMKGWSKDNGSKGKSPSSDIVALGVIGKVATPWDCVSLFPNVAYVTGEVKQEIDNKSGIQADLRGYQANLFGSIDLGSAGYLVLQPQFMSLDVEAKADLSNVPKTLNVFKMKTGYGIAFTQSKQWWAEISHTYVRTSASAQLSNGTERLTDNDNKFELAISYYF